MIHNLLHLLLWYTAGHHLMSPTPNNLDNPVNKIWTAVADLGERPPPPQSHSKRNLNPLDRHLKNANKWLPFCWQPHTARIPTIYKRIVLNIANQRMALLIKQVYYIYTYNKWKQSNLMVPVNEPIQISSNRLHAQFICIKAFIHRTLEFIILIKLAFQK